MNKKILLAFASFSLLNVDNAFAHVKWFIDKEKIQSSAGLLERIDDPNTMLVIAIAAFIFLCSGVTHVLTRRLTYKHQSIEPRLERQLEVITVVQQLVGCVLIINFAKNTILAPHFVAPPYLNLVLYLQLLSGFLFIVNRLIVVSCALSIITFTSIGIEFGIVSSLEYFNFIGLLAIFLFTRPAMFADKAPLLLPSLTQQEKVNLGVCIYRVSLGIALVTLGMSEKLMHPELALDFLQQYPDVNFMRYLGLEFSDHLFVMWCGTAEVLFGAIYIAGFVTRINTVALAIFLAMSNGYFAYIGESHIAVMEFIGHLPLIAGAIVLLVVGSSYRIKEAPSIYNPLDFILSRSTS